MKIKKLLPLLLALVCALTCLIGITACGSTCKTEYPDWEKFPEKKPTCTQAGNKSYQYCPDCHNYLDYSHSRIVTPEQMKIPALGHDYQNGKCSRCNKTDPALLPDTNTIPDLAVSAEGIITWTGIKAASKYRIEITDETNEKHVYDISDSEETVLDLTQLSDEYELAYGKNYASITAYKPYEEKVDGETVADDIPIAESQTDFIAIKQNSGYSLTQLTYVDDYLTINGAYSDIRTDGDTQYILMEIQAGENATNVKFNLSRSVKAAQGVTLTYYKNKEHTQVFSSSEWQFWYTPIGAYDYYLTVSGGFGVRNYVVRVLAVRPVQVNLVRYNAVYGDKTTLVSGITVLENDFIDISMFYSYTNSSEVLVDEEFNSYKRTWTSAGKYVYDDCVMPVCQGKSYNFYVIYNSFLERVETGLEEYSSSFDCRFIWGDSGSQSYWTLSLCNDYAGEGVIVPSEIADVPVLLTANTFGYNNSLKKIVFKSGFTELNSSVFANCTQLTEVYIPSTAKDSLGDFLFPAALKDTLTIYCCYFEKSNGKWNQVSGSYNYFNTVANASAPSSF